MDNVPIIYAQIYVWIKKRARNPYVTSEFIKEVVTERIICSKGGEWGGSRKGIPRCFTYDIIKELEKMNLIKKVDKRNYQILRNSCEKKVSKII